MTEEITIVDKEARHALSISETVGTMKLGKVMGPAFEEIHDHLKSHDITFGQGDAPFTRYNQLNWDKLNCKGFLVSIKMMFFQKWVLDMGIPCPDSVPGQGRIKKMTLDAGRYLRTIHKGPYRKVGDTYIRMVEHARQQNLQPGSHSIEFYLNDPRETPADQLETEVLVPVVGG